MNIMDNKLHSNVNDKRHELFLGTVKWYSYKVKVKVKLSH
jgi:hypothetical protein